MNILQNRVFYGTITEWTGITDISLRNGLMGGWPDLVKTNVEATARRLKMW